MSIVIAVILLVFAAVMWYQHQKGTFDGQTGWFVNLVLYGVNNHSGIGFCLMLAVMLFLKLWFLAFATLVLWLVYVAIRKGQSEKQKGMDQ
jgi:hypothetical protein